MKERAFIIFIVSFILLLWIIYIISPIKSIEEDLFTGSQISRVDIIKDNTVAITDTIEIQKIMHQLHQLQPLPNANLKAQTAFTDLIIYTDLKKVEVRICKTYYDGIVITNHHVYYKNDNLDTLVSSIYNIHISQ